MNRFVSQEALLSAVSWCARDLTRTVNLKALIANTPSLALRRKEARSALRKYLSGQEGVRWADNAILIACDRSQGRQITARVLKDCARILEAIASRAMTPKEICKVLEISNQEWLRWTKDGRLKTSGTLSFTTGRRMSVPTYPALWVADLLKDYRKIDDWRTQDSAGRQPPGRRNARGQQRQMIDRPGGGC